MNIFLAGLDKNAVVRACLLCTPMVRFYSDASLWRAWRTVLGHGFSDTGIYAGISRVKMA
jgi:hypothetical protein